MNNKSLSIISYITIIGWLIALFVDKENADDLRKYHLRQALGLFITMFILTFLVGALIGLLQLPGLLYTAFQILYLVLLILGIINAANAAKKPLPIFGKIFENKFSFIG